MKILNFGSCNIDYVYAVDHFVKAGETLSANSMEIFPGGKGLNQSIALARAGAPVFHAGYVGRDGGLLLSALKNSRVDISYIEEKDMPNGHAIIQVDKNGENCIFLHGGTNQCITREYIDKVLFTFSCEDILLLQNEINEIPYIIDKAHSLGIQIVFNPAPFTKELQNIDLTKISYLILNETEAEGFCTSDNPDVFIAYMRKHHPHLKSVITLGNQGSIYVDNRAVIVQSAYQVETVDTTAAGDTFIGFFLARLADGASVEGALKIASAASAITVSRAGASPSIPYMHEVSGMLKSMSLAEKRPENVKKRREKEIIRFIEENLTSASLPTLAARLGFSPSYTGTLCKEVTGHTFSVLLAQKRCEKAAILLSATDLPIGEIIPRVGYENESFFRKKFMEFYGMAPLKYRKERK
ncbi:MAG: helix-turn-helix domain-containing protein [Clostridia bacterium]|nr:helix-turn-helix domain-containing protein [Clostridia bacterium]